MISISLEHHERTMTNVLLEYQEHIMTNVSPDKKILILGGTGFIGPALIRKLGNASITCFHRNRSHHSFQGMSVEHIYGDRNDPGEVALLEENRYDYIIDLSCTKEPMLGSIEQLAGCCGRYIFISSSSIYDRSLNGPHTESEPLVNNTSDEYIVTKLRAEEMVRTLFPEHTIIRPSKVYGPNNYYFKESEFLTLIKNDPLIVLKNDPMLHFTYIDDLIDGITGLMDHNGTYNVAGMEPSKLSHFIALIAQLHGLACEFKFGPESEVRFTNLNDCILDLTKARNTSGYDPKYSLLQGLTQTFAAPSISLSSQQ